MLRPAETSESKEATRVKFIDFGNSYIMHPAYDILYFLYTTTDRAFRQSHFDALLRSYFDTFSTYLSGDDDLSYDKFKEEAEGMREGVMIFTLPVRIYHLTCFQEQVGKFYGSLHEFRIQFLLRKTNNSA